MSKKMLLEKCETLGIKNQKNLSKDKLMELIASRQTTFTKDLGGGSRKVSMIYHLADIHIRVMDRHAEYAEVFERLYSFLKSQDSIADSVIVICGDLFHNKDRFVSETILLFNDFVKKLSEITDTFLIVGNHDCFHHTDRLDSLSGIIDIANHQNLHLLKESGAYTFKNIQFGVSSLTDGMFIPADKLDTRFIKIALYHGCVGNADTGSGSFMTGMDPNKFAGYDLCLLGDIHKRQYLDKAKTVAYPGSLIQQNHGEELSHGLLAWDLKNRDKNAETFTSEYIEIPNDYSFMTIEVSEALDLSKVSFAKFSRVRLLIDDVDDIDIESVSRELEKYTKVLSLKKLLKPSKIDYSPVVSVIENLSEKETELITSLLHNNGMESSSSQVLDLHKKFSSRVQVSERDSVTWTIDHIEFRNIFSYGNDRLNRVDFNDGITGILGENAIGKSSILNTILYGIFGNVYKSQSYSNKNIISKYSLKQGLYVKISIVMDSCRYVIEREAKNKKRANGIGMEESVRFYSEVSGKTKELNLSTKPETETLIKSTLSLLNKQEFILTNLLSNVSYGYCSLLSMSNAQLEETFEALFDLEKYTLLHSDAKAEYKGLSETVKAQTSRVAFLESSIAHIDIDKTEDALEKTAEDLRTARGSLKENAAKLEVLDRAILQLSSNSNNPATNALKSKSDLLDSIRIARAFLGGCENIQDLLPMKESLSLQLAEKLVESAEFSEFLSYPTSKPIAASVSSIEMKIALLEQKREVIDNVPEFSEDYMKAKKMLKNLSKESASALDLSKILSQIKRLKLSGDSDDHYSLPVAMRDEIVSDLSTKTYIEPSELLRCKKLVSDKEDRDRKIHDNIVNEEKLSRAKKLLREKKTWVARSIEESIVSLKRDLKYIGVHESMAGLEKDLEYLSQNKKTDELISEKTGVVKESVAITRLIETLVVSMTTLEKDVEVYDKAYSELLVLDKSLKPKHQELKVLKTYIDIVHPKKLPKIIIKETISRICTEANKIIYNMTGMLCLIEEVNDKWEISLKKNKLYLGAESCSGYERFIINTGLKLGLDKFKHLSSVKMFLIDEMIDCVSGENIERVYELFDILKKQYSKVIVISHNEELKKKVEHKIDIRLDKKSSYIA